MDVYPEVTVPVAIEWVVVVVVVDHGKVRIILILIDKCLFEYL
jgi:hypothetical protein